MKGHLLSAAVLALVAIALAAPPAALAIIQPGTHQITNRWDGLCVDVRDAAGYNGAPVEVRHCVNAGNQRWTHRDDGRLQVEHSGKCLSVQWRGDGYGSEVVQDACDEAPAWSVGDAGEGWSFISTPRPEANGGGIDMCLDKTGWDLTVWDCWLPRWQQWSSLG